MRKRQLCMICLPVLIWLVIMGFFGGGDSYQSLLSEQDGSTLEIQGTVCGLENTAYGQTIRLNCISILSEVSSQIGKLSKKTMVLVYLKDQNELHIGNHVQVEGICASFDAPKNPGSFDAESYYKANGIAFSLKKASVLQKDQHIDRLRDTLYQMRTFLEERIDQIATENTASILKAMLLGSKGSLTQETKELFQYGGIIHILAISGLHISTLGMGFYNLLRKFGMRFMTAGMAAGVVMLGFGMMTGFPPSAKRAVLMFLVYLGAQAVGRTYDMPNALMLAGVWILFENPSMITQAGFLLSFAAVAGVLAANVWHYPWMQKSGLAVSISTWMFTLPLVSWFYFRVPVYGILFNLLVIPFMTPVMLSGLLGVGLSLFSASAGTFCVAAAHYILEGIQFLCRIMEQLPGMSWVLGQCHVVQIFLYYLFLLLFCFFFRKKRKIDLIQKAFGIILIISFIGIRVPKDWTMTFLNVGQGDGICIRTQNDGVWMIDGGSQDLESLAKYELEPYLESKGITQINGWILSHFDQDHVSGLVEILENYQKNLAGKNGVGISICQIIIPDVQLADKEENTNEMREKICKLAEANEIPIRAVSAGVKFGKGNTLFTVVAPQKDVVYEDGNQGSLVLKVEYEDFLALLTGDVEKDGEDRLTESSLLEKVDLLKVAHHGSKNGTSEEFLMITDPEAAVISCGEENRYGHPNADVLERLENSSCSIFRTDEDGALDVVVKKGQWYVQKAQ